MTATPPPAAGTMHRLPRYLALAYVALIVYASLHPFSGWRETGISPLTFLDAGWPHYWTAFDLGTNILAYLPLGVLLTLAFQRHPAQWLPAACGAILLGGLISFSLETLQTWLPSRVPSNLDLACNILGTALGALVAIALGAQLYRTLSRLQRLLAPGHHVDIIFVLVGLWLLTQLSPETLLFGAGDLRHLLEIPTGVSYAPSSFFAMETGVVVCNTLAIGLIVRSLLAPQTPSLTLLGAFFLLALTIRTAAAMILLGPAQAFAWLTPGAGLGLMSGIAALSVFLLLPPAGRVAIAGLALMAGTVLVNLAPANPYSAAAMAAWKQGHFLNFNGLTRLTASLWPFLALPCLSLFGRRR